MHAALERRHRRLSVREWWRADPDSVELLPGEELVPPLVDVRAAWRKAFGATRVDVADGGDFYVSALTQRFEVISGDQARAHNPDAKRRLHWITLLRRDRWTIEPAPPVSAIGYFASA